MDTWSDVNLSHTQVSSHCLSCIIKSKKHCLSGKKKSANQKHPKNNTFKNYIFSSALFCEFHKTTIAQLTMELTEVLYLTLIFLDTAISGHNENIHNFFF